MNATMPRLSKPIVYAEQACATMMRKFDAAELPPRGHFHYHQGVFLSGMYQTYLLTGNEAYQRYIKRWVDSVFDEHARIRQYDHADLDDIQPGILLYPLLDYTQDDFYRKAIESVAAQLPDIPRNVCGGFDHKVSLPGQMWLDGLYMSGPFMAEYAAKFDRPDLRELVIGQALLMEQKTRDPNTGLLYHAWDSTRQAPWANPATGRAPEFWGRSIGWVPVAVLDDLDWIDPALPGYAALARLVKNLLTAVCCFQSGEGRWYQVVNKGSQPGNWLENSCSCLFVAGICKAVCKGILPPEYAHCAAKGFAGVIHSLTYRGDELLLGQVCVGTGVGDYDYYCKRPVSTNDLHGMGAFLLMCTAMQRLQEFDPAAVKELCSK